MISFSGPPKQAIRNKPISDILKDVLERAASVAGIDAIEITSGGQVELGKGTRRTGSTRHDNGRAADLQCLVNGKVLRFSNQTPDPSIAKFVTAAAEAGATGIGAGTDYMGDSVMHIGFGTSVHDHRKLTWGARGRSATAPDWLRRAAETGWNSPNAVTIDETAPTRIASLLFADAPASQRYAVKARGGLKLRGGPGLGFGVEKVLALGTKLVLVKLDDKDPDWGMVDLQGDGIADGYVFVPFLELASDVDLAEHAPEPDEEAES